MDRSTSLYLNLCRFCAAILVFVFHYFQPPYYEGNFRLNLGREAVIIFFVISGYVIAYVTEARERSFMEYAINRLSRLYSVVIPALILTVALDVCTDFLEPNLLDKNSHTNILVRLLISFLFLNQSWNLTVSALSNGPFWSLCYEFWYYIIFGFALFASKKLRLPLVVIASSIAGPRIILLFPIWLLGVAAYKLNASGKHTVRSTRLFLPSVLLFMLIAARHILHIEVACLDFALRTIDHSLVDGYAILPFGVRIYLGGDRAFLNDYLVGALFFTTIVTFKSFFAQVKINFRVVNFLEKCAAYTFSLYLYHVPVLIFFTALALYRTGDVFSPLTSILLTGVVIVVLSNFTEKKKYIFKNALFSLTRVRRKVTR